MALVYKSLRLFSAHSKLRLPTIKFRHGIRKPEDSRGPATSAAAAGHQSAQLVVEDIQLPIRFKRPDITAEEMDYINRGGPA